MSISNACQFKHSLSIGFFSTVGKSAGVTYDINNDCALLECPSQSWQCNTEPSCAIPKPWHWSSYCIIHTCTFSTVTCQNVFCKKKADPDPDASYLSSGTPLPQSFNEHLSAHVALTHQKQPLSKFTCPETLPDFNDSLTCQSRKSPSGIYNINDGHIQFRWTRARLFPGTVNRMELQLMLLVTPVLLLLLTKCPVKRIYCLPVPYVLDTYYWSKPYFLPAIVLNPTRHQPELWHALIFTAQLRPYRVNSNNNLKRVCTHKLAPVWI